jgi:ubiquitin C-terminal hydrolase
MCDKLPFLDELCRFKIAHSMECQNCKKKSMTHDSVVEFALEAATSEQATLADCIGKAVEPYVVDEWVCESCKKKGGVRQQLVGTFPKCIMFHAPLANTTIDYSSILMMNKRKYALSSVTCFNGGHWWAYGRNMPPGSSWYQLNDTNVREHGPKQFPVSPQMRMLIYYRLDE